MKKTTSITKPKIDKKALGNILSQTAIENAETIGTAMLQTGQEFLLAIEEILQREWGFTEEDIKKLHENLEYTLTTIRDAEAIGFNATGIREIRALADIAEIRKQKEMATKSGIALPGPTKQELVKKLIGN